MLWPLVWIRLGALVAAQTSWILLIVLPLGGWTVLMRLRFDRDSIERTIGPFRQRVRLDALASIEFKQTGTWRSQGMLFVSDTRGHRVGIYVGRFSRAAGRTGQYRVQADRNMAITRNAIRIRYSRPPGRHLWADSRARLNGQPCSWTRQKPHTHRSSHGRAAFSKGQSLTAIRTPTDADTSE